MHLVDDFIQSDLQCIQAIHFVSMCSLGIEPTTFALLKQCSTTEPQEQEFRHGSLRNWGAWLQINTMINHFQKEMQNLW